MYILSKLLNTETVYNSFHTPDFISACDNEPFGLVGDQLIIYRTMLIVT